VSYRTGMSRLFKTSVFPDDPWALPAPQQRVQARRRLLELLPGAYLDANTYEYLRWVGHGGSQRPRPRCPGCRRRLDERFLQRYHDSLPLEGRRGAVLRPGCAPSRAARRRRGVLCPLLPSHHRPGRLGRGARRGAAGVGAILGVPVASVLQRI
jgi:hypothetical protein